MNDDTATQLEKLRKQIQDKKVESATLKTRAEELLKQMQDLKQQSKDEFGIDAEQLQEEIDKLSCTIEKGIAEVTASLQETKTT